MLGIFAYYKLPFEYTGNGRYYIGNKIPDFMSTKENKIIEYFGSYWHKNPDEGADRQNFFKSAGFNTLIIYDWEMKNMSIMINKIVQFAKSDNVKNNPLTSL